MKRTFILLSLIFIFCFTGCSDKKPVESIPGIDSTYSDNSTSSNNTSDEFLISNEMLPIYNSHNEKIGEFEHFGMIIQTSDSIIYAKLPAQTSSNAINMDYYRYVISTKKSTKLGTVKDWSQQSSEAVLLDNHLYLLVTTGNPNDMVNREIKLLDFDLNNNSMSEIFSEKGGFPYNSMTGAGNHLLIAKVLQNGSCIEAYDIKTQKMETVKHFDFDDKAATGEAIRQITADENTISLMMLIKETSDSVKLRIDVYDYDMNFLHSVDVTDISSDKNELIQGISNFEFSNNLLYYENFSMTRFLGKAENNKVESFLDTNDTFAMATETANNNQTKLFYRSFTENSNDIYLLDITNGKVSKASFYADDKRYYIINMSRDANDNILAVMYYRDLDTGEKLIPRLYYIKQSDLNFN